MTTHWFLTVDWCKQGRRGIFTDMNGKGYWKKEPYTRAEMDEILGPFWMVLAPKCLPFTEEQMSQCTLWTPLAEYSDQFGYVQIPEDILSAIERKL